MAPPPPGGIWPSGNLLSGGGPLQSFGPSLQEICQRFENLGTIWQETAVKVYHAEKTLQLLDVLRGWAVFDFGGVIDPRGRSCRRNRVSKNFKRGGCKNTFFQVNCQTIGSQSIEKSLQVAEVCLPVRRANSRVIHVCKHTFQTICGSIHHSLEGLGSIGQAKGCEKILKQAKGG